VSRSGGLRVLQVLGSSAGGVARHVAQVGVGGQDRGWQVLVAGPSGVRDQVAPASSTTRFRPVEITDRPTGRDPRAVLRLRSLARDADVVHAHGLRAGALTVLAVRALGRRARPPVVVTLHNLPVGGRPVLAVAEVLERVVAHGADAVLGVSGDLVARAAARGARRTERALVPAPPRPDAGPAERTRAALGLDGTTSLLVTVGRLAPQKGLDLLADAARLMRGKRVLWVVAGEGPSRERLADRVRQEGLPVRLLGRRDDVADLMAAADVVVSTARWEGQPLGVQEALALGAAVVATDVGGTREVTGDAAVLVPQEAEALAQAVLELVGDARARDELGARARRRAAELPDLTATLGQLERVYRAAGGRPD
jgi:glycosyltransferase involved in cell wall biosynthesis